MHRLLNGSACGQLARSLIAVLAWAQIFAVINGPLAARDVPVSLQLRILATTDIHSNLMDYDYYRDQPDIGVGLVRTASLIKSARAQQPNNILLDAGDLLQGAPLADMAQHRWMTDGGYGIGAIHPDYLAMNRLNYDAATIGNHEFNYGLPYLEATLKGARFPYVSANLVRLDRGRPRNWISPAIILKRRFRDILGRPHLLQIGIIGATPPQIMTWDKDKLTGKIDARDITVSVRENVGRLKSEGADIIIVLAHTGIGPTQTRPMEENVGYQLTKIRGVDAVVLGHSHQVFPSDSYVSVPDADLEQGTINGKPVVMAGYFGSHLGVIDLVLKRIGKRFGVVASHAEARSITKIADGKRVAIVDADPALSKIIEPSHKATIAYAKTPIARTDSRIHTYLALLGDNHAVGLVHDILRSYASQKLRGTNLEGIPLLIAASAFKAGGRYGVTNYTDIGPGPIQVRNVIDLYLYPNTFSIVKVTGAELREWLEMTTRVFEQVDVSKSDPQPLIDLRVPAYNLDVIDGITYTIDVTQPVRYDRNGKIIRSDAHRIRDVLHDGHPVGDDEVFLVGTNNYRAEGGDNFPGLDGSHTVFSWPETIQDIISRDMQAKGDVHARPHQIWQFAPLDAGVHVTFDIPSHETAIASADPRLEKDVELANGMTRYRVNLSRNPPEKPLPDRPAQDR